MSEIFSEISLVLVLAGLVGIVLHLLKQPAIVAYVLTGLIVGPLGYMELNNTGILDSLSEIGVTLLLFMVGLELSLKDIRQIGWVVIALGFLEMAIVTSVSAVVLSFFGLSITASIFLGLGLGFSSTILAVKALSEKKDLDSLYGKLVLGILITQDLVAIVALSLMGGFDGFSGGNLMAPLWIVLKLLLLFGLAVIAGRTIFPRLIEKLSGSSELIFLISLAWGLGFATLISQGVFNLTPEIGGFLAGLTLANTTQHIHIASRMRPLRDFFLILFFIVLGSELVIADFSSIILLSLGILALAIVVKPLFMFILVSVFGFRGRTSFLTASSLAHISEFSIILAVLGREAGHLDERTLSAVTLATILSFITGSYALNHSQGIAKALRFVLAWWDPDFSKHENSQKMKALRGHIVLVGAHRIGHSILHSLEDLHKKFLVIDFNPAIVKKLKARGISTLFGDISDPDVQDRARIDRAKLVISTVTDLEDNLSIIETARLHGSKAKLILSASSDWEARKLYDMGADYVLMPHFLSGLQLAELLRKDIKLRAIGRLKHRDLELIQETT